MELPTERPPPAATAAAARRVLFGFGAREIGVAVGAAAVIALAATWYRHDSKRSAAEAAQFRAELAMQSDVADVYRDRMASLRTEAAQLRREAEAASEEPARAWSRERARRFESLIAALEHRATEQTFDLARRQAAEAAENGDLAAAKTALSKAAPPVFPPLSEYERLRDELYQQPLAEFSRQSPDLYRAFRAREPELARRDEQKLRAEIAAVGSTEVTPQTMLKVDLLAAVAAPGDPQVTDWAALAGAMDYFENPDGATLAAWRRAQHAVRTNDWAAAAAEMRAINKTTARTRAPFRAAFGRALLHTQPDDPAHAYSFVAEAARAGDKSARLWLAQEDVRQRRYAQAERWLEAAATDGDPQAVAQLVDLYANKPAELGIEPRQRVTVLERVVTAPEAPAEALVALGRLYEQYDPRGSAAKAVACYRRAAKRSAAANLELARCALAGIGMQPSAGEARIAACDAFKAGETEAAAAVLSEVMRRAPEGNARAIAALFGIDSQTTKSPFLNTDVVIGPGCRALRAQLARYFDQMGDFARAAQLYTGATDSAAEHRRAELTRAHACDTCGGTGKVSEWADCPTCGGTGKQICSYCGGTGVVYVPGTPPCATCGGSGTIVQDRKVVSCGACGGTGHGKASVIPQPCTHCDHGYIRCRDCTNGHIRVTKECPDCHGRGAWTLVERTGG